MEHFPKNRILVVDDDPAIGRLMQRYLALEGFDVRLARSGAEAAAMAREGAHDIVLCDIKLPDADGIAVLRELKRMDESIPVIMITGR